MRSPAPLSSVPRSAALRSTRLLSTGSLAEAWLRTASRARRVLLPVLVLVLALSTLLGPSRALADDAASTSGSAERARELLLEGTQAINAGDFAKARTLLSDALELVPTYDIAAALGQAELELGEYPAAAQHLALSLDTFPPSESPELKQTLKQALSKAKKHVASLELDVSPEGAEVLVDGVVVGQAPLGSPLFVAPGPHHLEARLAGSEPMRQTVQAVAGQEQRLVLRVAPAPASAENPTEPRPQNPASSPPPSAAAPADTSDNGRTIAAFVGAGLSLAALATGIVFAVRHNSNDNDANVLRGDIERDSGPNACASPSPSDQSDCRALQDKLDQARSDQRTSNIFLWTGAGFAVAGIASYLLWPETSTTSASSTNTQLYPVVAPGTAAFALRGTF